MSEILDIPSLYKLGAQKPPYLAILQLKGKLTAYTYSSKYDIHKRANALQTTKGLLHRLKTT